MISGQDRLPRCVGLTARPFSHAIAASTELSSLDAAAAGQRSLEHLLDLPASCVSNESALRAARAASLAGGGVRTAQDFVRMRRVEEDSAAAQFDAVAVAPFSRAWRAAGPGCARRSR